MDTINYTQKLRKSHLYSKVHNGMMSMMMRSFISAPLGGVISGAIYGACPGDEGSTSA